MEWLFEREQTVLLKILEEHHSDLLRFFTGITYLDVGFRFQNGRPLLELAIRVHVRRKMALAHLALAEILPRQIAGITVDVIQSNPVLQDQSLERDQRFNPIPGGVAIANRRLNGLGTLGAVVFDKETLAPHGLSAHHVLVGDTGQVGDEVMQPASNNDQDVIGRVSRWSLELDCAVFHFLDNTRSFSKAILGLPRLPKGIGEPVVGMKVTKSGRTTGVTYGIIDGVNNDGFTIIPDQERPAPDGEISSPGDSGAIWLETTSNTAIGLHVAGEADPDPNAERAWAKRLGKVISALNVMFELPDRSRN